MARERRDSRPRLAWSAPTAARNSRWTLREVLQVVLGSRMGHFLVLGGLIYFLTPKPEADRIDISSAALESIRPVRGAIPGATPEQAEKIGRQRFIEDEVLVREAQRLGLADGDPIVRARLVQKVLFLAEDMGGASRDPTQAELQRCFQDQPERYRVPETFELVHVFSRTRRASQALTASLAAWTEEHPGDTEPPKLGDAFPLRRYVKTAWKQIEGSFGEAFARGLQLLRVGEWSGVLQSRYGFHRVKLLRHEAERAARFEEVLGRLKLDCSIRRREQAVARFMRDAFERYDVEVDGRALEHWQPLARTAPRSETSAEDL